jgi:hypothetical protein
VKNLLRHVWKQIRDEQQRLYNQILEIGPFLVFLSIILINVALFVIISPLILLYLSWQFAVNPTKTRQDLLELVRSIKSDIRYFF